MTRSSKSIIIYYFNTIIFICHEKIRASSVQNDVIENCTFIFINITT